MTPGIPPPDPKDPVQELYSETDSAVEPAAETPDTKVPLDEDDTMKTGQNWLEALQTDAVEDGVEPEREIGPIE